MSIIVKSQAELDRIPLDTDEQIYIEFGSYFAPAIVRNKYRYSVVAWENSSVVAWENSSVEAWENSSVVAWENSSVEARGNVQVVDRQLSDGRIQISDNARKVYMPKNIEEFMNFYGIKHDKTTAVFYKAVHKVENEYLSDYDSDFKYMLGDKVAEPDCSNDTHENCCEGIHISHLAWALNFGRNWSNLAILEVEVKIKDIIMPIITDGKIRVPEAKVLREVPLSECGLYGKILERRRTS